MDCHDAAHRGLRLNGKQSRRAPIPARAANLIEKLLLVAAEEA
jgi:hypothetical protein